MSTDNENKVVENVRKEKGILSKLKGIKHIEWIVAGVLVAVLLLVYAGVSSAGKKKDDKTAVTATYADQLEEGLETVLAQIKGVGKVKVLISFKGGKSYEYAEKSDVETETSKDGEGERTSTSQNSSPVIVNNNGKSELLVKKEILPEILGVIVVAEGAADPSVKFALRQAVTTALKIESNNITIFTMK